MVMISPLNIKIQKGKRYLFESGNGLKYEYLVKDIDNENVYLELLSIDGNKIPAKVSNILELGKIVELSDKFKEIK